MTERLQRACSGPHEPGSPEYALRPEGIGNDVAASPLASAAASGPPDRCGVPSTDLQQPPAVQIEVVTVTGPDGEALERTQLAAIREVLQWLHDNPDSTT